MSGPWEDYANTSADDEEGPWSAYSAPAPAASPAQNAFERAMGQSRVPLPSHPLDILADVEQGAISAVPKFGQFVLQGAAQALPKSLQDNSYVKAITSYDWDKATSGIGSGKDTTIANIARGIGSYLPFGAGGIEEQTAKALPQLGEQASSILGQLLSGATAGATLNPQDRLKGAITGAGVNAATAGLTAGLAKSLESLRPSKALRGTLSPQELAQNLEQAKGTTTGLGDVIGNKTLKNTLNTTLPYIPGTGANDALLNTAQQIQNKGDNLLLDMLGNNSDIDAKGQLQDALSKSYSNVQSIKRAKADALNTAANDAGLKVKDDNLNQVALDQIKTLQDSPRLAQETSPELLSDLQRYAKPSTPDGSGEDLKSADIFQGILRDKAQNAWESGDLHKYGIYKSLKDAKQSDVDSALENTDDESVKNLRDDYRKYYREEVVPYDDPDVKKYINKGGDPDLFLNTFLKTGVNDRGRLLSKVMDKLPDDKKSLMAYSYYSRAIKNGKLDPQRMATLHRALGEEQKKVLFQNNPELKKAMDQHAGLVSKNTKALNLMAEPQTGITANVWAPLISAGQGAGIGATAAGLPGAIVGGTAGLALPTIAGKQAVKALTSEKIRENLVKAMLENKPKFTAKRTTKPSQILAQGIANSLSQGGQ